MIALDRISVLALVGLTVFVIEQFIEAVRGGRCRGCRYGEDIVHQTSKSLSKGGWIRLSSLQAERSRNGGIHDHCSLHAPDVVHGICFRGRDGTSAYVEIAGSPAAAGPMHAATGTGPAGST